MALNRQVNDGRVGGSEQNNSLEDQPTGVFDSRKKELEEVVINTVRQVIGPVLKPLISEVVKTEIESALEKILTSMKRNSGNEMHPSELRSLQLQFSKKLSLPILTGMKIKGEGGTSIQVALVDGITGQGVNFGPEASAKMEIVVLGGDFNADERHDWTLEEFNQKIVREREGNVSLLTANVYLNLKEGIGYVDEISFTHNRKWMKRCQFRLGARVMDNLNGTRVREAMTECFFVEDRRSKCECF
ncbi:hypothetical protein F0562_023867 [Nyssa sinensis]|uniref:Calmodulin binding protein-like N-terminal domain-containing protein n=1 Tax=Nyssa sinensis TaxID=561372 RepID=A0A5J5BIU5_9ASTE|nr:hypothetical protein F0562_023867 [Nyssa sinensis]